MPCFHPMEAFKCSCNYSSKSSVVFSFCSGCSPHPFKLPCGQCIGCRLERSRQWAIRCVHEAQLHSDNCFITLTYSPEHLPKDGSLNLRHYQLFMKRLRKKFGNGIRFFHCGEYGEKYFRPHYHACLFGFDFPDKVLFKEINGVKLYTSDVLNELWGFGFCSIGDVNFDSAAYVARYILKKVTGKNAALHYANGVDLDTGEVLAKRSEYITMSRRPGIGSNWFDLYSTDVYPSDEVVLRGRVMRPPKFYDSRFKSRFPEIFDSIKESRIANAVKHVADCSPERLRVRETVQLSKLQSLPRNLE